MAAAVITGSAEYETLMNPASTSSRFALLLRLIMKMTARIRTMTSTEKQKSRYER